MKKKIILVLCILIATLNFVGCSGTGEGGVSKEQKEDIRLNSQFIIWHFTNINAEVFEQYLACNENELDYELMAWNSALQTQNPNFSQYLPEGDDTFEELAEGWAEEDGLPKLKVDSDDFRKMITSWQAALEECGEYESCGEFTVDEEGLTVSAEAKFKDREATISFSFNENQEMQSMDVSAKYSIGEILTKAGLNTLLGMGTVFAVLIFLAFLIALMKYIPVFMALFKKKEKKVETSAIPVVDETVTETEDATDDLELVAVITAAIAAQEGTEVDGFVVRSIRRRPSNNWI